jgi:hypothetical protein
MGIVEDFISDLFIEGLLQNAYGSFNTGFIPWPERSSRSYSKAAVFPKAAVSWVYIGVITMSFFYSRFQVIDNYIRGYASKKTTSFDGSQ